MVMRKPYRRRRLRPRRKMGSKRRYVRHVKRAIPRAPGPPISVFTKVRYSDRKQVALGASGSYQYYWRLNSVNDCDASGGGGQPLYHDQYSAMYNNYRVYGTKVDYRVFVTLTGSQYYAPYVCMVPYVVAPGYSTIETAMQAPFSTWRVAVPGQHVTTLRKYYKMSTIAGISKTAYSSEENYSAVTNQNPLNSVNLQTFITNNDGTASIVLTIEMTMTFYVKYYNRLLPNAS